MSKSVTIYGSTSRLIVPQTVVEKRNAAKQACDSHYWWMTQKIGNVFFALQAGARGEQCKRAIESVWPEIDGHYITMIQIAEQIDPALAQLLGRFGPSVRELSSAIANYLHGDGDVSELLRLAAKWGENAPDLIAARQAINQGGSPQKVEKQRIARRIASLPAYKDQNPALNRDWQCVFDALKKSLEADTGVDARKDLDYLLLSPNLKKRGRRNLLKNLGKIMAEYESGEMSPKLVSETRIG